MNYSPLFSIIFPCFNEESNIGRLVETLAQVLPLDETEIILVNNGSTDNTLDVIKSCAQSYQSIRVIDLKENKGYGDGIYAGLLQASGKFLGWSHSDLQTPIADLLTSINLIKESGLNDQVAIKGLRRNRPMRESIYTIAMSIFESLLFQKILCDINAQPNFISKKFFKSLSAPPTDSTLDLFYYYMILKHKISLIRFPVHFLPRRHGKSHWNQNIGRKVMFILDTIKSSCKIRIHLLLE